MTSAIHQVIVGASRADAITSMAIETQRYLRKACVSEIYSFHDPEDSVRGIVRPLRELEPGTPADRIIYHVSYGIPQLTEWLLGRRENLDLVYHNITPAEYFEEIEPAFALGLRWGRLELEILRNRAKRCFAVSEFNASELRSIGFEDVEVLRCGLNPYRLAEVKTDVAHANWLNQRFPEGFVLVVAQVLPHKRIERAIEAVSLVDSRYSRDVGLVIAGPQRLPGYLETLLDFSSTVPGDFVHFAGVVTESVLATLYRECSVFLSTSDHEGLSVPILEAMAEGAPVVARAAGAVPETAGSAACLIGDGLGSVHFAEAVRAIIDDPVRASTLRAMGRRRACELAEQSDGSFVAERLQAS